MPLADRRPFLRCVSSLLSPVSSKHVHISVEVPATPSAAVGTPTRPLSFFSARRSPTAPRTPHSPAFGDGSQGISSQDSTPSSKLRLPTEVCAKRVRMNLPRPLVDTTPQASPWGMSQNQNGPRMMMSLLTPSSCASASHVRVQLLSPTTPDPLRNSLKLIAGDAKVVVFDFDGTLTATPGELAQRPQKAAELKARASLLEPRLRELRNAGLVLCVLSKSSEHTVRSALEEAGLLEFFDGPIVGKAVGFEGKAGFIIDGFVRGGQINDLGPEDADRIVLIDDDVRELDRARARGIQTYAAPATGGLQEADFDEILAGLGVLGPSSIENLCPLLPGFQFGSHQQNER